jgi:hypothetical protein
MSMGFHLGYCYLYSYRQGVCYGEPDLLETE